MKINGKTLKYKITSTRLPCKVQHEHTVYTTTLLEEEICRHFYFRTNN